MRRFLGCCLLVGAVWTMGGCAEERTEQEAIKRPPKEEVDEVMAENMKEAGVTPPKK